ncbi:DUF58 domain-containing protein [uncultured Pseudokineococcus sp.]|uniref:DUF58 domain-containing protein n=1 Tax=uncultured Pseudokineococcus sp. TaxID=1642928 RepID=UPI002631BBBF|nr:DUF58 domain-containing protein [uncultured Pseudokineococcus sp.]
MTGRARGRRREAAARARASWGALTARGAALTATGVVAAALGVALGHRDLVRLAVLLLVLPLAAWVGARAASPSLVVDRAVSPGVVPVGGSASVRLDLHGRGRGGRTLLAEDLVPPALRASPRFVVEALPEGTSASVRYALRGERRGRHPVGPLRLVVQDPFGLVAVTRSTTAVDPLLVVPALVPLAPVAVRGDSAGASSVDPGAGEDDVVPREYRPGDDRRRVHWRTSARRGELMVRRDERPRRAGASVLLDRRAGAVTGADDARGVAAFERAVAAAASAAERLARDGLAVRLLLGGPGDAVRADARGRAARLERLALVTPEAAAGTTPQAAAERADEAGAPDPGRPGGGGRGEDAAEAAVKELRGRREDLLVVVCGPREARALAAAPARRRLALVVARGDEGAGTGASGGEEPARSSPARSGAAGTGTAEAGADQVGDAVRALRAAGWGAARLGPDDDLSGAWAAALRGGGGAGAPDDRRAAPSASRAARSRPAGARGAA